MLQRQQGIIRDAGGEGREEVREVGQREAKVETRVEVKGEAERSSAVGELIVPDTLVMTAGSLTVTTAPPSLLQVPAVVVGPRDNLGPAPLPKQRSHPTPLLAPNPVISKQLSHPESRGSQSSHPGPPPMTKQRSHPSVLTHTPALPSSGHQHLQVIPMQVFMKQHTATSPSPSPATSQASQLRPIQPKPSSEAGLEVPTKKDVPLIHLTPSEDSSVGGYGGNGPPRLPRAVSEEPGMIRPGPGHTPDLLASPGQSMLVQSVSQDSGLDVGVAGRMLAAPQMVASPPILGRTTSTPGHCPVLRQGPALGCNFCWNSTDPQGRVLRRKTKYHCPECRTNLCIVPCFHEYHKQIERAHDTDKQITKILTKTGSM